jgi:hypothetical protein
MLRNILVVAGVVTLVSVNAFAQQEKANPYLEKMQQTFNQANETAAAQFKKDYPAPSVSTSLNGKMPAITQQAPSPPPPPKPVVTPTEEATPAVIKPVPDLAVNPNKTESGVGNIYAAGGGSKESDAGAINPYR